MRSRCAASRPAGRLRRADRRPSLRAHDGDQADVAAPATYEAIGKPIPARRHSRARSTRQLRVRAEPARAGHAARARGPAAGARRGAARLEDRLAGEHSRAGPGRAPGRLPRRRRDQRSGTRCAPRSELRVDMGRRREAAARRTRSPTWCARPRARTARCAADDVDTPFSRSAKRTLSATYTWPFQSHGSIGPSAPSPTCAPTARRCGPARRACSRCAARSPSCSALPAERVRAIYVEASGCYGHNGADDAAAAAALSRRRCSGRCACSTRARTRRLGPQGPGDGDGGARRARRRGHDRGLGLPRLDADPQRAPGRSAPRTSCRVSSRTCRPRRSRTSAATATRPTTTRSPSSASRSPTSRRRCCASPRCAAWAARRTPSPTSRSSTSWRTWPAPTRSSSACATCATSARARCSQALRGDYRARARRGFVALREHRSARGRGRRLPGRPEDRRGAARPRLDRARLRPGGQSRRPAQPDRGQRAAGREPRTQGGSHASPTAA